MTPITSLAVPLEVRNAILNHAAFCEPYEACGLLAFDTQGSIRFVYACTNRARSPVRYVVDPTEHFRAIQHAEAAGWSIGGVFHSHPDSEAVPSSIDEAEALDPTWIHLIVSGGVVRAWRIDGGAHEVQVEGVA